MKRIDEDLLLVIKSSGLGAGEPDLGETLLASFITQLLESGRLPALIIFINTGVFLTTTGSPVLDLLKQFSSAGSEIQSCSTCLKYYHRQDELQIGTVGNMRDTVQSMLRYRKVLEP